MKNTLRLLAGLLLFDLLLNLPGLDPSSPVASLLAPSIDLLVVAAVCLGAVRAAEASRRVPRIVAAVLAVLFMVCTVGERFGYDVFVRLFGASGGPGPRSLGFRALPGGFSAAVSILAFLAAAAAAFLAAYFISGLVVAGYSSLVVQNIFLLLVAASVIVQVLLGVRVFAPSIVPRVIQTVGALMK